jgi:hypothetical protein
MLHYNSKSNIIFSFTVYAEKGESVALQKAVVVKNGLLK